MVNYDMQAFFHPPLIVANEQNLDGEELKGLIEDMVDEHAKARVDILSLCVFARYSTVVKKSSTAQVWKPTPDLFPRPTNDFMYDGYRKLEPYDRVQIVLDQCRKRKIKFVASLRMNDRHRVSEHVQKMFDKHPQWQLQNVIGIFSDRPKGALDFKYAGVRNALLAYVEEFFSAYDADGMEFDFMRMCHMFDPGEAVENAHLLTEMVRKARSLTDAAAQERGRKHLLLGVRVPQTIEECHKLGYEIETWIKEGLIDYICPSDFWSIDFNMRTEDFTSLTKGTNCKVYPSIHPVVTYPTYRFPYLGLNHYCAAANNAYAFGADGISTYNYFWNWSYPGAGPGNMWPNEKLRFLEVLRDLETIRKRDRHYLYYIRWRGPNPTGKVERFNIVLSREAGSRDGFLDFRLSEDLKNTDLAAVLEFKVTGMEYPDQLEIGINKSIIKSSNIVRSYNKAGRSHTAGGRPLRSYFIYRIKLTSPPMIKGDNRLTVRLTNSAGTKELNIQELEVKVTN